MQNSRLLTSLAKRCGVDAKIIHATINPIVKQMMEEVTLDNPLTVRNAKEVLRNGYVAAGLPSVARVVELFLDSAKSP